MKWKMKFFYLLAILWVIMVEFSIYMKPIPYFSLQVDFRLIITAHCKSLKSIMVINACSLIRNLRKVAMYLNTSSTGTWIICLCLFHLLTCPSFAFYQIQLNDGSHAGIEALESHPIIKRITPHKKLSRSLKFVKGTRTSMLFKKI